MTPRSPMTWVGQHAKSIAEIMQILDAGLLEAPFHNAGLRVLHKASKEQVDMLPLGKRLRLVSLLASMGFFAGQPVPNNEAPDYTLVLATHFDKMVEVFRQVIGQDVVCIASSRTRFDNVDGNPMKFAQLERQFADTEWCRWAKSPGAGRPHGALFGLAALAMLVASDGTYDLSGVVPQDMLDSAHGHPERIQLTGAVGEMTILPHKGTRYTERHDLKHWLNQLALHKFPLQANASIRIVAHALSVTRLGFLAAQTIQLAQPNCHVTVVAAPVPSENQQVLITDALVELTLILTLVDR